MTQAHAPIQHSWLQLHRAAVALTLAVVVILGAWAAVNALGGPTSAGQANPVVSTAEQATRAFVQAEAVVTPAERATRAYQHSH